MKTKRRYFVIKDGKPREILNEMFIQYDGFLVLAESVSGYPPGQWYFIDELIPEPEIERDGWCIPLEGTPDPYTFTRVDQIDSERRAGNHDFRPVRLVWADEEVE